MNQRTCLITAIAFCLLSGCKSSTDSISESTEVATADSQIAVKIPVCHNSDDKFVCINNEYICTSDKKWKYDDTDQYCGGVALSAIVKGTDNNRSEPVKIYDDEGNAYKVIELKLNGNDAEVKIQSEKDNTTKIYTYTDTVDDIFISSATVSVSGSNYECHYGHWVCYSKEGCACFDGINHYVIAFGETCEPCKNSQQPPALSKFDNILNIEDYDEEDVDSYEGDNRKSLELKALQQNANVCMKDSCPCGDGACMKYGVCQDGVCKCGNITTNLHDEFICTMYYNYEPIDGCSESHETDGILVCPKAGGCHTRDGRHFPQWATIGSAGYNGRESNKISHIDSGFDTTIESTSVYGECVLDRSDGLMGMTLANGAPSFVCDKQICSCGKESCRLGEVCDNGKCREDTCQAHIQNDKWCNINLNTGICDKRDFYEKIYIHDGDNIKKDIKIEKDENGRYYENTKSFYLNQPTEYYNGNACTGGHRYCHGKNNDPIPAPDKAQGYQCLEVTSLPGTKAKDHLKTWLCMNENGCACGESQCKYGDSCIDNACVSVTRPVTQCHGKPLRDGYECLDGQRCSWNSCPCGNTKCQKNEYCSDGQCYIEFLADSVEDGDVEPAPIHYPVSSDRNVKSVWTCEDVKGCSCNGKHINKSDVCRLPCYGDGKLDDKGCWCGDKLLKNMENETCLKQNDQYQILCNDPAGCTCGNTKCPMTTYCSAKKCIDPLTGNSITSSSEKLLPATSCSTKTCTCGLNTCHKGQFCIGEVCRDKVYSRIVNGNERIFYDMKAISEYAGNSSESYFKNLERYVFHEIQSNFYGISKGSEEYVVVPEIERISDCGAGGQESISLLNYKCASSSGCTCGTEKCSMNMFCEERKVNRADSSAQSENNAVTEHTTLETDIASITAKEVYEPVIALAPEIDKCYKKVGYKARKSDGTGDSNSIKIMIDYDEYGVIYGVDSETWYDGGGQHTEKFKAMDKCVKKALPEKFNIDFSENIKIFSDDVQKFGWFELIFNIVSKEITIKNPSPAGTPKAEENHSHRYLKHFTDYQKHKKNQAKQENNSDK